MKETLKKKFIDYYEITISPCVLQNTPILPDGIGHFRFRHQRTAFTLLILMDLQGIVTFYLHVRYKHL
jgi:hypothetical protein